MNNTIKSVNDVAYPDKKEMQAAVRVCCGCNCKMQESPVEYAWRKRKILLTDLLEKAINEELTETERSYIKEYYYNNNNSEVIAGLYRVSSQAVRKTITKAENKLMKLMRYAVMYADDTENKDIIPLKEMELLGLSVARNGKDVFGRRLMGKRLSLGLSRVKVADALGFSEYELKWMEEGRIEPGLDRLRSLCGFYGASANELLGMEDRYGTNL